MERDRYRKGTRPCLCSFVKSSTQTTVYHFRAENQSSERLSHLQRLTQHSWAGTQFRLAPRPREGQRLVYITQLGREGRNDASPFGWGN